MRGQGQLDVVEPAAVGVGRADYLKVALRNQRPAGASGRAGHRPRLLKRYPAKIDPVRAAALVRYLRVHDEPRHWAAEHKPCWCRCCWWARWELEAAGELPADLVVTWAAVRAEWT